MKAVPDFAKRSYVILKAPYFFLGLPAEAISILAYLIYCQRDQAWCWPSVGAIAEHAGVKEEEVEKRISFLSDKGVIQVGKCKTGRGKYRVVPIEEVVERGKEEAAERGASVSTGKGAVRAGE